MHLALLKQEGFLNFVGLILESVTTQGSLVTLAVTLPPTGLRSSGSNLMSVLNTTEKKLGFLLQHSPKPG